MRTGRLRIFIIFSFVLLNGLAHAAGLTIGTGSQLATNDGALKVDGDIAIAGTLTVGSGSINLSGNWSNNGTFTAGTGTITLDGISQSLSGITTFHNLSKVVVSADTLTFPGGQKTTIANALTLQGASGQLLSLRSDSADQWEIDPQGTRTIQYLDVQSSNNVNGTAIDATGKNCQDSGNNTNWLFQNPPTVTSFTPSSGGTGTSVTITGSDFTGATAATFGGTAASSFSVNSATLITATVAGGATGRVAVTTPGGTAQSSTDFTFVNAPTVTAFTPASGGSGTSVTINGTNFTGATVVTFGGTAAASFTVNSATQIAANVAGGATGKVAVTTPGGTAQSSTDFTFVNAPTVTSFTPTSGGNGTSVTITGTNFSGATAVKFGGTDASDFTVYSFTQIAAVVADGSTGTVAVTTPGGTATSSSEFTYAAVTPGTYYVDIQNGNDSNAGTAAAPWKTLHHAIDQINGGSTGTTYTLHVALGTYNKVNGEANTGLTISQSNVTVEGASGSGPIIDGTGATYWAYGIKITGSNVTLRNLYITGFTGTDPSGTGIEIISGSNNTVENCRVYGNHDGISVWQSDNCTIQGSEIDNNDYDGISITESANSIITQNSIHDNFEVDNSDGIIVEACSPEISQNTIYDNRFNVSLQGSATAPTSPFVKNNLIYESTLDEVHYGIYIGGVSGSTVSPAIYHNTIDGSLYQGILIEGTGDTPSIKYNIITNCRQSGIQNSGIPTIDYNDVWHNGPAPYDRNYDGCSPGANDISQDPLYGSYTLQPSSPCINTIPSSAGDPVTLDYPGYKRPKGTAFDMGAYEYVGSQTDEYPLPGGTGQLTDYRIFTVPFSMTGAEMLSKMETTLGAYNSGLWRIFAFLGSTYIEINTADFAALNIIPGMGFWIITTLTDSILFQGPIAPDGVDYRLSLPSGWSLMALPWTDTDIDLGNIQVTDGLNSYSITSADNNLAQRCVWHYTGVGLYNGYEKLDLSTDTLACGTGYFFKVLSTQPVTVVFPPSNATRTGTLGERGSTGNEEEPPPPPGGYPSFSCPDISGGRLENVTFPSNAVCLYLFQGTLTIGSGVSVAGGASVTIHATKVIMETPFNAEEGAVLRIEQP
jgi:parallel beta-helix repeat protein